MNTYTAFIRGLIRVIIFILLTITYFLVSLCIHITSLDKVNRRRRFSKNGHFFSRLVCLMVNIKVTIKNPPAHNKAGMLVGNHMGFVDIFSISSLSPNLFVTSKEMHQIPVIGLITEFAGCV